MSYNPFGCLYDRPRAKAGNYGKIKGAMKTPPARRTCKNSVNVLQIHIEQLTEKEKRLSQDPAADPAELAKVREDLDSTKAELKRQTMKQSGDFLKNAVLK